MSAVVSHVANRIVGVLWAARPATKPANTIIRIERKLRLRAAASSNVLLPTVAITVVNIAEGLPRLRRAGEAIESIVAVTPVAVYAIVGSKNVAIKGIVQTDVIDCAQQTRS